FSVLVTLSPPCLSLFPLHDALPISYWYLLFGGAIGVVMAISMYYKTPQGHMNIDRLLLRMPIIGDLLRKVAVARFSQNMSLLLRDRKSTRLNSSHGSISYAVFCLKK